MQTATQLYADARVLTAPLIGDASITLIENWPEHCGVLLAASCWQQSWSSTLHLEEALWVRYSRRACTIRKIARVALMPWEGFFGAMDSDAGLFLPNLSVRPFCTVFLPAQDFQFQHAHLGEAFDAPFFRFVQAHFAGLPGFAARENALTAPDDYAMLEPPAELKAQAA